MRFTKWRASQQPAVGVTPVNNPVGHNNLHQQTLHRPRFLSTSPDSSFLDIRVIKGSKISTGCGSSDTVVVPDRRNLGIIDKLYGPIYNADTIWEKECLFQSHEDIVEQARAKRAAFGKKITDQNDPNAYIWLKNQVLTVLGGHTLVHQLDEARNTVIDYINGAFTSTAPNLWTFSKDKLPLLTNAPALCKSLNDTVKSQVRLAASDVSGDVSMQVALEGAWKVGVFRGLGAKGTFHIANYSLDMLTPTTPYVYPVPADPGYIDTFSFILKGPEVGYDGFLSKANTDLEVSLTTRVSNSGQHWRVENICLDLKHKLEFNDWSTKVITNSIKWLQADTSVSPVIGNPFADLAALSPKPSDALAIESQLSNVITALRSRPLVNWDSNSSASIVQKTLTNLVNKIASNQVVKTFKLSTATEVSFFKFVIPNGDVIDDPYNTKAPFVGNFQFVGGAWGINLQQKQGAGFYYDNTTNTAKYSAKIDIIGTGSLANYFCVNDQVRKAMQVCDWNAAN